MSDNQRDETYAAIFPTIQSHFDHSSVLSDLEDAAWEVVNVLEDVLKPRTITTYEELDALARDAVVMSETIAYQNYEGGAWAADGRFYQTGQIALPAVVLYEPAQ